jgi:predicted outer membrane repeat protein
VAGRRGLKPQHARRGTLIWPPICLALLLGGLLSLQFSVVGAVTTSVDCVPGDLAAAIQTANPGDTLSLQSGCIYDITSPLGTSTALPAVTAGIEIEGNGATITAAGETTAFGLLGIAPTAGSVTLDDLTLSDGMAEGGAVLDQDTGSLTITNTTFSDNGSATSGDGGAIYATGGTLDIASSTFSGNAGASGGAIDVAEPAPVGTTISSSTFTDNAATNEGGAIDNADGAPGALTLTQDTFTTNTAGDGGALSSGPNAGSGTAVVSESTFTGNTALDGGAIDNADATGTGTLTVSDSTFSGNVATGATPSIGHGGAIDNGDNSGNGTLSVSDSTFSANGAINSATPPKGTGGAIDSGDNTGGCGCATSSASLIASTFSKNTAATGQTLANGQDLAPNASLALAGDILYGLGNLCAPGGQFSDDGYNVAFDATCLQPGTSSILDTELSAQIGSLGNFSGPTQTIPILSGPGLNYIPNPTLVSIEGNAVAICPGTDQRGIARPQGSGCDVGAFEAIPQSISFTAPPTGAVGARMALVATGGGSGGQVYFTTKPFDSKICQIVGLYGRVVHFLAAGKCVILANQFGNGYYTAAPTVQVTIDVAVVLFQTSPTTGSTTAGVPFKTTLQTTGGVGGDRFTLQSHQRYVTVSKSGVLTDSRNTPVGTYTFGGGVRDADGDAGHWVFELQVVAGTITQTSSSESGMTTVGTPFTAELGTVGDESDVMYTTVGSSVLTVTPAGEVKAGGDLPVGTYSASGTSHDAVGNSGTWTFTLTVVPGSLTELAPLAATVNIPTQFTGQIRVKGGAGKITFVTTTASTWVVVHSSGYLQELAGTPAGTYTVQGTDSDARGDAGVWSFTLIVRK